MKLSKVDCSRGAPMGRYNGNHYLSNRKYWLSIVKLDSGGYDNGGAYWGSGTHLWVAKYKDFEHFVRADTRLEAVRKFKELYQAIQFRKLPNWRR